MAAEKAKGLPDSVKQGFKFTKATATQPTATEVEEIPTEVEPEPALVQPAPVSSASSVNTSLPQSTKSALRERATFYLDPDQATKLDELILQYRKHTGKRVNRNEIVRYLIDACDPAEVVRGLAEVEEA